MDFKDKYNQLINLQEILFIDCSIIIEKLLDNIKKHGNWHEIENMDNTNFYFEYDIEKVSKGYLYFYNFDYHNKVFDAYDYYNNIKLGGTISQYYRICVIDIEKNVIWFYETERII